MKTARNTLLSIAAGIASTKVGHLISDLEVNDVLRPLGLSRRSNGWFTNFAFLGAGIVVGGVAALLLAPASGAETREKLSKKADELGDKAAQKVRELGDQVREEATAAHARFERNHGQAHAQS